MPTTRRVRCCVYGEASGAHPIDAVGLLKVERYQRRNLPDVARSVANYASGVRLGKLAPHLSL
jgi:hypothetical protein